MTILSPESDVSCPRGMSLVTGHHPLLCSDPARLMTNSLLPALTTLSPVLNDLCPERCHEDSLNTYNAVSRYLYKGLLILYSNFMFVNLYFILNAPFVVVYAFSFLTLSYVCLHFEKLSCSTPLALLSRWQVMIFPNSSLSRSSYATPSRCLMVLCSLSPP